MIYHFVNINQVLLALVICPIIALGIGFLMAWFNKSSKAALIISFLLPLIYVTGNWTVFVANLDAWFMWGIMYVIAAFIGGKLAKMISRRNT